MTKYTVKYTKEAKKKIEKLDASIKIIIKKAIESIASDPYKGKPLAYELSGLYSFRTSDYRIIYEIIEKKLLIVVLRIRHRNDVYDGL